MAISKEQIEHMLAMIENEGFDYYFNDHSSCDEIKDEKFHELKNNMINARQEFRKYLMEIAKEHIDDEYYIMEFLGE